MTAEESRARVANIFDVARLAGVSHQTVSRVVNDLPNVRPATRLRVEEAIKQLRYRPSTAARALVTKRSRTLGLITTGAPDYGPSSIVLGFNEAARVARYSVLISSMLESDAASMRAAVELLLGQNVEAIILVAAHRGALESMQTLDLDVPLVAVESSGRSGFHSVSIDHFTGAYAATEHLITLGHRRIGHVAGPRDSMDAIERLNGWRSALADHAILAPEPFYGDWSPRSGYEIGNAIADAVADRSGGGGGVVGGGEALSAVFSANDQMALGVIRALTRRGIRVPDDVSIVGFDDIPEAEFFSPPLTTMRQDFGELGRTIMATVVDILRGEDRHAGPHVVPQLVLRESSARRQVSPAG